MELERIDTADHVGKKLVRIDFRFSLSPMVHAVVAANESGEECCLMLSTAIQQAIDSVFSTWCWVCEPGEVAVLAEYIIVPLPEQRAKWEKDRQELSKIFAKSNASRIAALQANPNNGTLGWWRVDGVRHCATVRASSAFEAVEKAAQDGAVGSWEGASADFIGTELPEVH